MYKKVFQNLKKSEGHNSIRMRRPHFIFSAEAPRAEPTLKMDHTQTMEFLKNKGYHVEEADGMYDGAEKSIVVHSPHEDSIPHLFNLATNLGQESSIYSNGYDHEMHFHHGENAGKHIKGKNTRFHKYPPENYYTSMQDGTHFTHNFDWDDMHEVETSITKSEDLYIVINIFDEEENDLKKSDFYKPETEGQEHPTKPYVAVKHPDSGNVHWHHNEELSSKNDRIINNTEMRQKFLSKLPSDTHKKALNAIMDKVASDPNRHFIPSRDSGKEKMRARHIKALLLSPEKAKIELDTNNVLNISMARHGTMGGFTTWKYNLVPKKVVKNENEFGKNEQGRDTEAYGQVRLVGNLRQRRTSTKNIEKTQHREDGQDSRSWRLGDLRKNDKPTSLFPKPAHSESIRKISENYAQNKGFDLNHPKTRASVNTDRASNIAQAYHQMKHDPNHPEVKNSYNALIKETSDQFHHIKKMTNMKFSKMKPGMENPYKSSKDLFKDMHENNHMWYYPTEQGFGSGAEASDHPMLGLTEHKHNDGTPMVANDIFRIVHDFFGHAKEGNGFGSKGEEHAWHTHRQMYSPLAQKAMTTETRGQNSWVNFGPHAEHNRKNPAQTIYAEQKAGLLPDWAHEHEEQHNFGKSELYKSESEGQSMVLHHYSNQPGLKTIDPANQGGGFDSRKKGRDLENKISFYYPSTVSKEDISSTSDHHVANAPHKYTVKLDPEHKVYNASNDKEGFAQAVRQANNGVFNMDNFIHHVKQAGYHGMIIDKHPTLKPVVSMFYPMKVHEEGLNKNESIDKQGFENKSKYIKKYAPLMKGSLQRKKMPFSPRQEMSESGKEELQDWVNTTVGGGEDSEDTGWRRENLPNMTRSAKKRAMHKLHGLTEVRKNPETGERMFLLHRGVGTDEHSNSHSGGKSSYEKHTLTSWSPHHSVAQGFSNDYNGKVVSAWVPESDIHSVPNQLLPPEEHEHKNEHEVVVNHTQDHHHAHPDLVLRAAEPKKDIQQRISLREPGEVKSAQKDKSTIKEFGKIEPSENKILDLMKGDLSGKIKTGLATAAMAASISPKAQATEPKPTAPVQQQIQQVSPKEHILNAISDVESSGGKNTKHARLPASSIHRGERAYGSYGLTPLLVRETVKKHTDLMQKYGHLTQAMGDKFHSMMSKHPELEKEVASRHYDRLVEHFGHDPSKISMAWLNGITGTKRAIKKGVNLNDHWHVKKVLKAYTARKGGQ